MTDNFDLEMAIKDVNTTVYNLDRPVNVTGKTLQSVNEHLRQIKNELRWNKSNTSNTTSSIHLPHSSQLTDIDAKLTAILETLVRSPVLSEHNHQPNEGIRVTVLQAARYLESIFKFLGFIFAVQLLGSAFILLIFW